MAARPAAAVGLAPCPLLLALLLLLLVAVRGGGAADCGEPDPAQCGASTAAAAAAAAAACGVAAVRQYCPALCGGCGGAAGARHNASGGLVASGPTPHPAPVCSGGGFVRQPTGSCPAGTGFIETEAGCAAAAASLGLPTVAVSGWGTAAGGAAAGDAASPHGCYFKAGNSVGCVVPVRVRCRLGAAPFPTRLWLARVALWWYQGGAARVALG